MSRPQIKDDPIILAKHRAIRDAISFRKPDHVPYLSNVWTWKFLDAGMDLRKAFRSHEMMMEATDRFLTKYPADLFYDIGNRNPVILTDLFEDSNSNYVITEDTVTVLDSPAFSAEQYGDVIGNYDKALWEIMLFNKYPAAKNMTVDDFANATKAYVEYTKAMNNIVDTMQAKHHIYCTYGQDHFRYLFPGIELLFNYFRGIKGLSMDLRRHKAEVKACGEYFDSLFLDPLIEEMDDGPDDELPFDYLGSMMVHTILSLNQFENLFWPSMKKVIDACAKHGKQLFVFSEGSWLRFVDYFQDVPKGVICMCIEGDDPYECRELLPNISICGGMPTTLLANSTPKECTAYAKRLIDDLGTDGGLLLSESKMCSFRNDVNPENLKATMEFVTNYKLA